MPREGGVDRGIFERPAGSGKWWACWKADGKTNRKYVGNKTQARSYYEKVKATTRQAELFPESKDLKAAKTTVEEMIEKYRHTWARKAFNSNTADDRYATYWIDHMGKLRLVDVTPGDIDAWRSLRLRRDGVKGSTINRAVTFLCRMFNLAIKDKVFRLANPAAHPFTERLPEPRKIKILPEEHDTLLLEQLLPELMRATEIAILTGMRAGEQLQMRRSDLSFSRRTIAVEDTKDEDPRYLHMSDRLVELFQLQLASHTSDFVWPGKDPRRPRDQSAMNRAIGRACERAKIKKVTWHAFRHTFGTRAIGAGADVRSVMEAMGHESMSTTDIYTHVSAGRVKSAMELVTVKTTSSRRKQPTRKAPKTLSVHRETVGNGVNTHNPRNAPGVPRKRQSARNANV